MCWNEDCLSVISKLSSARRNCQVTWFHNTQQVCANIHSQYGHIFIIVLSNIFKLENSYLLIYICKLIGVELRWPVWIQYYLLYLSETKMKFPDPKKVKNIPTWHLMTPLFFVKLNYSLTGKAEKKIRSVDLGRALLWGSSLNH